ncbi:ATP-dependent RNA helicase, putative [Entamoeba invadens IP1]|uniref:ATP-dependent RNA helicase, putative n=1 Tax=Entamoeba invadens IP1 TaxID=370355 RepID=UPI0002C3F86D|nr:ATP-dependent RNA helicase, putative [Entamoeba invadens IP1]ELP90686.1 ATP-dependent RNA helicase, putative [Entamoeba invadens IP1]|eukprot:XP_004257457.1 ATP-dependent RNA helicase, putative [Entamoeba invadens IP1]
MSESDSQFLADDVARLNQKLRGMSVRQPTTVSTKIKVIRESLPAFEHREEIIQSVRQNQVVIISGDTGCGKSTQVPQFIFEDALANNEYVKIACTQPRRIAATSLAERVSEEVGCSIGTAVGYQIGLEKMADKETNVLYLTPGVLQNQLMRRDGRTMYTHIIIDEAHERDIDTEFCLMLIRKFVSKTTVRLIIMSAMMDVDLFRLHFMLESDQNVHSPMQFVLSDFKDQEELKMSNPETLTKPPLLNIGGKRYPVDEFYLEDVLEKCGKTFDSAYPFDQEQYVFNTLYPELDKRTLALGVELIALLVKSQDPICILVFLPGMAEIEEMRAQIESEQHITQSNCVIKMLHSTISMVEQKSIFIEADYHRIILSSNIAESSITVPGVKVVINFGMEKVMQFDPLMNIEALKLSWISGASETQRVGRAGRVSSGQCFHMYPREFARHLARYSTPEIQRTSLETIMLKVLEMGEGRDILDYGVQPPATRNIERSVDNLLVGGFCVKSAANDSKIVIAPLGKFAVKLPLDYRLSKLVFFGLYFGIFTECAKAAALFGTADWSRRDTAEALHRKMNVDKLYSDVVGALILSDSNRREVTNTVTELIRRIFIDPRDKKLYDKYPIKSLDGEYRMHLALFAAFYPSYFTTESADDRLSEAIQCVCASSDKMGQCKMDPWYTIAFRNVPDEMPDEQFGIQLQKYFERIFGKRSVIQNIRRTDRFRLVEFIKNRDDTSSKQLHPWGTEMRYVYMALEWLSQTSFYVRATAQSVSVRTYSSHTFGASLVNYFTHAPAKIEGGSSLAPLMMKKSLKNISNDSGEQMFSVENPDYAVVCGIIGESNSGNTMCRKINVFPTKFGSKHLPLLAMLFTPTPVLPLYNKAQTKLRGILFAHLQRSVVVKTYIDETTLIGINKVREDIKRFMTQFEMRKDYARPTEAIRTINGILEMTREKMAGREIPVSDSNLDFIKKLQISKYLFGPHLFSQMNTLKIPEDLELSEDDEVEDASNRIDQFLYLEKLAKGWYPEKEIICAVCKKVICHLKNVKRPEGYMQRNVIGVMTCVFGLLKPGVDPRIGCCMNGHQCCLTTNKNYILTPDSSVKVINCDGVELEWSQKVYDNFFAGIGGTSTEPPPIPPGDRNIDYACPFCQTTLSSKEEFLKHTLLNAHRTNEQHYRQVYTQRYLEKKKK